MDKKHLAAVLVGACALAAFGGVERVRLSDGWEFMRADGSANETNSAAWRAVRVPHDWGVEKSFDPAKPYGDAYLEPTGIGWYRRTFRLDPARVERHDEPLEGVGERRVRGRLALWLHRLPL